MKPQQRKIHTLTLIAALSFALAACGGGSSAGSSTETSASSSTNTSALAPMQGTYATACFGDTNNGSGESNQVTITITAPPGGSEIDASVHNQYYVGSTDCTAATLNTDLTVTGQLSSKSTTKAYIDSTGKSVTAKVLTFAYSGLTLSKGSFSGTLPVVGVTTDVAYVFDGSSLYLAKGGREADGLGDSLSPHAGVKQ